MIYQGLLGMRDHIVLLFTAVFAAAAAVFAGPAAAADCGCAKISASSSSDSGICTVQESDTSFCTLTWRHGRDTGPKDESESAKAEAQTQTFLQSPEATFLAGAVDASAFMELQTRFTTTEAPPMVWAGAATYLEETRPSDYDRDLALASYVALIGSGSAASDSSDRAVFMQYLAKNAEEVLARLTGTYIENKFIEMEAGVIADLSSYGCLEIRQLRAAADGGVKLEDFSFRFGVRTIFAEDSSCLRRQ